MTMTRWARLVLGACPIVASVGCTKTLISSKAPNGSAVVQVKEFCSFPDCIVNVTVQTGWWKTTTIAQRSDCILEFAHVAWSSDSRIAGIYVDNSACSSIHEGYDVKAASRIPFSSVADLVRQSIIREYGVQPADLVPYDGDPLRWAHYPGSGDGGSYVAIEAFRKKYR